MSDLLRISLPIIVLIAGGIILLLLGLFRSPSVRRYLPGLTLLTVLYSLAVSYSFQGCYPCVVFALRSSDAALQMHSLSLLATYLTLALGAVLVLTSWLPTSRSTPDDTPPAGEYFAMILFSLAGLLLVFVANNLIVLFLALELASIPTYILVALSRRHRHAAEAALKYFYLGALSAALIAFGFSFLYGLAGSTRFRVIQQVLALHSVSHIYVVAFLIVIIGLCFKIAAVPMHLYVADVYQGAAAPISALLAFLPKFAGFYALALILSCLTSTASFASAAIPEMTICVLWILSALTITVGNVLALMQRNVKRILAYSSVAHSGYIMLALLALLSSNASSGAALGSLIFYVSVYALATIGAFSILSLLQRNNEEAQQLSDLSGLARSHPLMAAALAVCIFSLIGMPLTAGFIAKFTVLSGLVQSTVTGNITLLVIALINVPIAAAYYLRIIAAAYMDSAPFTASLQTEHRRPQIIGITLAALLSILLGLAPNLLLKPLDDSAAPTNTPRLISQSHTPPSSSPDS